MNWWVQFLFCTIFIVYFYLCTLGQNNVLIFYYNYYYISFLSYSFPLHSSLDSQVVWVVEYFRNIFMHWIGWMEELDESYYDWVLLYSRCEYEVVLEMTLCSWAKISLELTETHLCAHITSKGLTLFPVWDRCL